MTPWNEELSAYIDGELDAQAVKALEAQLAIDPELKALEVQLRKTVSLMALVPAPAPSASLRRSVLEAVDAPTWRERVVGFLTPSRLVPAGVVAAACVAGVVVLAGRQQSAAPIQNEEQLFVAQNIEVLEDFDVVGLERSDDLDVVAHLHELNEGKMP